MPRVKRGPKRKNRRVRVLKLAKGYYGTKHNCFRIAELQVERSLVYATRDRKQKKREFRGSGSSASTRPRASTTSATASSWRA